MIRSPKNKRSSMATSRDIDEVIIKLSSDKAKSREDGVKLLSSWLEGERSIGFCRLLARNTERMKPDEIPRSNTWPFLLTLLMKCIMLEIPTSKKRPPKPLAAKTLRTAIQCAEDPKFGGKTLLLLCVVKQLFNHIWDVIKDVPNLQSEYSYILRHLLTVKEYRYQMRKRVYCSLVVLHMNKAEMALSKKAIHSKEELFRCIVTLHALLESPPGDFPDNIREDIVKGFIDIFSNIRDEGKISRKLMECINTYLTKDGPNLGCQAIEIHYAVQEFMFRWWLSTHDRGLKNSFIMYARLQLKLNRSMPEGGAIIEQLLDVVTKELDQCSIACTSSLWSDTSRDDKVGSFGSSQQGLMDLAAAVFYQACTNMSKISHQEKRLKMEHAAVRVKDGLMKGLWLWNSAFCFLIHNYGYCIDKSLLINWFDGTCESLQRLVNSSTTNSSYDSLLWLLRALQEMSSLLTLPALNEPSRWQSFTSSEVKLVRNNWDVVWTCLMHGLPVLSNATPVVDAALTLLGNMILREQIGTVVAPQDIWDLRIFKHMPSTSVLYFISCYFSRKGAQGDLRDILFVRRNLLRASLELLNCRETICLNEQIATLIPAAAFSLSAGCAPLLSPLGGIPILLEENEDCITFSTEAVDHGYLCEVIACSVEALAEISGIKVDTPIEVKMEHHYTIRLPRQVKQLLLHEVEEFIIGLVTSDGAHNMIFVDLTNFCCLLCTWIYCSRIARLREEKPTYVNKLFDYISKLLDLLISKIEETCSEILCRGCIGLTSIFDASGSALASIKILMSCPLFSLSEEKGGSDCQLQEVPIKTIEKLLVALAKLFTVLSSCSSNNYSGASTDEFPLSSSDEFPLSLEKCDLMGECSAKIVDMDLDVDDGAKDVDPLAAIGTNNVATSLSPLQWKLKLVSVISTFFSVSPLLTWKTLLDLTGKENDPKVSRYVLYILCKYFPGSAGAFSSLVPLLKTMMEKNRALKLSCINILTAIESLLGTLLSLTSRNKLSNDKHCTDDAVSEENLEYLGGLLNEVADRDVQDWFARVKLINCICCFVLLEPRIAQAMIGRLLAMLQDSDYRVRLFLARNIGVLFQTWDGHDELFHDICSNFGFTMVRSSKEKLVKAPEVLAADPSPSLAMETVLICLAHIALFSEEVEVEAVFMICVVAAMEPCQRKLVYSLLDNISKRLQYSSRAKYLEELMGSILARWVACEVSLVALVEVQDLFGITSDTKCFLNYCCPWLLPPLFLRNDISGLNLVSKVTSKPLCVLAKEYFVPIFSVCMGVQCSAKAEKETSPMALLSSVLEVAEISELERDNLIKRNMVSIISFLLSLTSLSAEPTLPYFTKNTVVSSVQTIVDGFLEIDEHPSEGIVDKINIFRPDRVFKFLLEMHFQITTAIHPRHKCHRLFAIEVLISIIGNRAALSSTSNYIISIVGQFIGHQSLQDLCCDILCALLEVFKVSPKKEVTHILGEQLQFMVSKLVACCIPSENGVKSRSPSPRVISLLHQLIVDADKSLHDHIRELEPFPELDCLERVRMYHENICKAYSTRDRFLMFVRRSCSLPQGLLLWSLNTLHGNLRQIITQEINDVYKSGESNSWKCDPEVVTAVWTLVGLCGSIGTQEMGGLLADFVSRVGIGDPYRVVFHLPKSSSQKYLSQPTLCEGSKEVMLTNHTSVSDDLLITLLRILKKYLMDDAVNTVDITSRTLQGILSTEKGHNALSSLDSYERSLLEVHSKGVSLQVVEKLISDSGKSNHEGICLEDSSLWSTASKTYETWICSLLHSLVGLCDDTILRLCQDVVKLKSEVAELLFENVLVNLAGRKLDVCQLISEKIQENILSDSNSLLKSIQVLLNAMNRLRSFHVTEKASSISTPVRQAKSSRSSISRGTSGKSKNLSSNGLSVSFLWEKVYWLSIDYLVVAKAAIRCGSYFTAIMYVEHWCEEHFNRLTLGSPDYSHMELLPHHIELLVAAITQINEPDSIYGIIQSHKLTSQLITYEHEGNWSKALEYYDLLVRSPVAEQITLSGKSSSVYSLNSYAEEDKTRNWKYYKGLMKSLQNNGCTHVLDKYCQGLTSQIGHFQNDSEFTEFQYEAAWRAGNWDFTLLTSENETHRLSEYFTPFNENLHSCFRALQEGDTDEFHMKLVDSKKELVLSISDASRESTQYIYSTIVKLQILDHLGLAWNLRWKQHLQREQRSPNNKIFPEPIIPTKFQMELLNANWNYILRQSQVHLNLLEPFIAFRRVMLQILGCKECMTDHLLQSASTLRKGSRFSLATAALHELKLLYFQAEQQPSVPSYFLGRLEEAKILRAQGQHEMAISLAKYILQNGQIGKEASNVHRLVGKWLAETRSSNSRTILEQYLKRSVELNDLTESKDEACISRQCQTYFHLAHYTDVLFKSYEERLASSEWQAALQLRKHKTKELDALIKRLKSSSKGEKTDYSIKIQELQKQLTMDREEAERLQDDRDSFLSLALDGYQRCLVLGGKYDLRVVFRLVSLWFSLYTRHDVVKAMHSTVKEVQSYKFIPLVYQIASRLGISKDGQGSISFQLALVCLLKKMAIDHPYHTMFQLLALANGDRIKDKQRSRNSFVVDMDKKIAAENLLNELSSCHGAIIRQMKQMVDIYIKLAELETRKEETNRKIPLPREIRSLRQLELVPVVTATISVDPSCQYKEGSFPHFRGLEDSVMVMNGINAPKVVECFGSDGHKYRQLAKSGNDDLRQDAVMEQFFGLVNNFLQNHRDTWKRRLGIRTYKVVPFTPSAGVLEWVDRTVPLGEYLLGSTRNGGAHARYGVGDWSFLQCREHMTSEKDKGKAFLRVCENFRPVMHYFFLERFLQPADWFESRLSYTRSVATSSMVGYIVGLGDRHSMNILIDQTTAEVVHIDLGVAFEQGLMLKTPERVPFRLTRDIIDGMGVTGVEGVFRRCCEETLSVMRTNKEALLTIIEVFIHDPLYKWALSPLKALQRQKETDNDTDSSLESSQEVYEGNKDAARATLRVKQKLDGYEEGEMRSVQGQVQQLIQDAIDTDRLCQMFPGWGAWL